MNTQLRKHALALAIAAALPCHIAFAADEQPLPKVLVNGTKANVMQADVSRRGFPSDASALLQEVPGVSMAGGGGVSGLPSIRGLGDDRLRIQVDGMDLISSCANHMNPALSYIAPSQVDSIQVLAGITPVSAGGDSIGGTIRVRSADPAFAEPGQTLREGRATFFYRSNGNVRDGSVGATVANETFSASYHGESIKSGNYKAGGDFKPANMPTGTASVLGADEVGSSAYESRNHSLTLATRSQSRMVELKLGAQRIPYQGFPNQRMDMTRNDSEQVNLRYLERFGWGALEARAYHEHTRHSMNFGDDKQFWYGTNVAGMPMETEGRNTGLAVKASAPLSETDTLRAGMDYQRYRLNDWWPPSGGTMMAPNTFWNIRDGERDRVAGYGEWERRWNPAWFSQFGVRLEQVTSDAGNVAGYNAMYAKDANAFNARDRHRSDNNLDLTAQARYVPDREVTYKFGYARKTRSPNLYERYTWSTMGMAALMVNIAGDGNGYAGDPDLRPEVAHTLTASADWHDAGQERWSFAISPFYTYVHDYVDARCMTTQCARNAFVLLRFANANARLYGTEVAANTLLGAGSFGRVTGSAVVNYVRGENRSTGDNLYNIMPLNARLSLVHQLGAWTNTVEAQGVRAKQQLSQVRNEMRTAGYGLLAVRSSYAWKRFQLDVGVDNLLDRRYDQPLGGAYVGQGRTMSQTGVPYGIPVPGMGRSVYAGITVKL